MRGCGTSSAEGELRSGPARAAERALSPDQPPLSSTLGAPLTDGAAERRGQRGAADAPRQRAVFQHGGVAGDRATARPPRRCR
eukprot:COSAG04_NODE_304_length_17311_cov_13.648792_15_plen_83_part_00